MITGHSMRHGCATEFVVNRLRNNNGIGLIFEVTNSDNNELCDHIGWSRGSKAATYYISNITHIVKDTTAIIQDCRTPESENIRERFHQYLDSIQETGSDISEYQNEPTI
eukprot:TRINITY_DN681_c0_g2_i1.p1 TRINITY_DN681_c0_g2~~TRINITY_DN681_c0_g2_i1.p1  ORF type:complete len:110 (-),score=17.23 TRINITY_DN681_c0_g2_i1:201-530(-)